MRFHIVIAMYNVDPWISGNIQVLREQSWRNFNCILVDDVSTDNTVRQAVAAMGDDDRFTLIENREKKYKTRNVVEAIESCGADDEDVIVMVDGDDRLAHTQVLAKLAEVYRQSDCWMTYGSYRNLEGARDSVCCPYSSRVINSGCFRKTRWLASHLKTFKYKLWKRLDMEIFNVTEREIARARWRALLSLKVRTWWQWRNIQRLDLLDASGRFIRRVDDKAFTYPMLEMSGSRAVFIKDILYQYGLPGGHAACEPVYGEDKSEKWHTRLIRDIIVRKSPYPRIDAMQ